LIAPEITAGYLALSNVTFVDTAALSSDADLMIWRFLLFFTLFTAQLQAADPEKTSSIFEIRMVYDQPTPNATELELARKIPDHETVTQKLIVARRALLDASSVKSATVMKDHITKDPQIMVRFSGTGTKQFSKITRENIGRQLAIVIEGKLIMAPRIQEEIPSGSAVIHGDFTPTEAKNIADKINQAAKTKD